MLDLRPPLKCKNIFHQLSRHQFSELSESVPTFDNKIYTPDRPRKIQLTSFLPNSETRSFSFLKLKPRINLPLVIFALILQIVVFIYF